MKVLVIGSGGREHALVWKVKQSPLVKEVYCAPGNAGTAQIATNVDISWQNSRALALWALEHKIDLTIVGPEEPLSQGLTDIFEQHGLRVFGPSREAARLEWSKAFAKEVMQKAGVRTPHAEVFTDYNLAKDYLRQNHGPIVVKADGLAAGKGVVVAESSEEAERALEELMVAGKVGASGRTILLEECILGQEASVMALVDGDTVLPLVISQDYKRALDGDKGPNTGGMGAISPTPVLDEKRLATLVGEIFVPVVAELWSRGIRYRGFLYAGVIVDRDGIVKVLEFNCRLGDPETQVLMMRLESDLVGAVWAGSEGKLSSVDLRWRPDAAVCVVLASTGYPGNVDDGKMVTGLFADEEDMVVFHAGTRFSSDNPREVVTKGGRIFGVTARGRTLAAATRRAYEGAERISFAGKQWRRDIGVAVA